VYFVFEALNSIDFLSLWKVVLKLETMIVWMLVTALCGVNGDSIPLLATQHGALSTFYASIGAPMQINSSSGS
jgi:hypothetical protein